MDASRGASPENKLRTELPDPGCDGDRVITGSYQSGLLGVQISRREATWTATRVWTNTAATMNFASPVAAGEFLYGVGPEKNLVCVNAASGRTAWSQPGPFSGSAGNSFAAILRIGDTLLVVTDSGRLCSLPTTLPPIANWVARRSAAAPGRTRLRRWPPVRPRWPQRPRKSAVHRTTSEPLIRHWPPPHAGEGHRAVWGHASFSSARTNG